MARAELLTLVIILTAAAILWLSLRRVRAGTSFAFRPLVAFSSLRKQIGMAIESGQRPAVTLGRGAVHTAAGPSSIAAVHMLDQLMGAGSKRELRPRVTLGAATLLPVAQESVRRAYESAGRLRAYRLRYVEYIADESFPWTYAAGAANAASRENAGSSVAVGRFGPELAIIGEAAHRTDGEQIMGSDASVAVAIATAYGEKTLWGEELFAASAYLQQDALSVASLWAQDVLRWIVVFGLLLAATLRFFALI